MDQREERHALKESVDEVAKRQREESIRADAVKRSAYVRTGAIAGGITQDTLYDVQRLLGDALPLFCIFNHITANELAKFMGPVYDSKKLLHDNFVPTSVRILGVNAVVTRDRVNVKDDCIHILATDGKVHIIQFC